MGNICQNTIAVMGLKEPPEEFIKKLSKVMFDIDLDNMDLSRWGNYTCEGGKLYQIHNVAEEKTGEKKVVRREVNLGNVDTSLCQDGKQYSHTWKRDPQTGDLRESIEEIDGRTWYAKIVSQQYPPLAVLVPYSPFTKSGVSIPRFRVDIKWRPAYEEVKKASEEFPDLLFHVQYFIEQDGPTGQFVLRGGTLLDETKSGASWYLFDELKYSIVNLLPVYMDLTLAQRGAARIDDAIEMIEGLRGILDNPRFIESPFHEYRSARRLSVTKKTLDDILIHMRQAAKDLTFNGVFLEEAEAAAEMSARELEEDAADAAG
jgi:hypothetical protein